MKNSFKTFPKFDSYSHPYIAEWKKGFEAELRELLKEIEEDAAWKRQFENQRLADFVRGVLGDSKKRERGGMRSLTEPKEKETGTSSPNAGDETVRSFLYEEVTLIESVICLNCGKIINDEEWNHFTTTGHDYMTSTTIIYRGRRKT